MLAYILAGLAVVAALPFVLLARGARVGDDELLLEHPGVAPEVHAPRRPPPLRAPPPVPPQDCESWPGALNAVLRTDGYRGPRDAEERRPTTHYALAFCATRPASDPEGAEHAVTATRCGAVGGGASFALDTSNDQIDCEECRAALGRSDLATIRVWHLRAGRVIGGGDA